MFFNGYVSILPYVLLSNNSFPMWKQFVKDYLSFTRGERRAVIVLVVLIIVVFILPYWLPGRRQAMPDKQVLQEWRQPLEGKQKRIRGSSDTNRNSPAFVMARDARVAIPATGPLFYFDPNTLPAAGWKQLGLQDKTIQTILHYRDKGGRFRRPEDIGKIYGLYQDEYARLLPYVKIAVGADTMQKKYSPTIYVANSWNKGSYVYYPTKNTTRIIEVNTADTNAFIALPGIGSRLANRIINFRNKLGGFYCVEQVGETYALPDSTFQLIKHLLKCDSSAVRRIDINTADVNMLKQHPYIRWNVANAIVAYRIQHGTYTSVDELQKIDIITPDIFSRLKPYVYVP
jgi:DNA uptake protein ComE-like DNA-binding protein